MKKLYSLLAVAAMALSANATIYVVGDGNDLAWSPDAPKVVELVDGAYTFTATNLASMKISTTFGDWDTFNAGAVACTLTEENLGTEVELTPANGNIVMPWTGDWTFVINEAVTTLKATTTTPKPAEVAIYVRGGMNNWGTDESWRLSVSPDDTNVYTFSCTGDYKIGAGVEFKIADASWGQINYGPADAIVTVDEFGTEWNYNSTVNAMFETDFEGTIEFHMPAAPQAPVLVKFLDNAGVSNITVDNNAPREYFNLQGVRVANPTEGLYIVRQGSSVSKVLVK